VTYTRLLSRTVKVFSRQRRRRLQFSDLQSRSITWPNLRENLHELLYYHFPKWAFDRKEFQFQLNSTPQSSFPSTQLHFYIISQTGHAPRHNHFLRSGCRTQLQIDTRPRKNLPPSLFCALCYTKIVPCNGNFYLSKLSTELKLTSEAHQWSSPVKLTSEAHQWSSPVKLTREARPWSSLVKKLINTKCSEAHQWSSPVKLTSEAHQWSSLVKGLINTKCSETQ
jgi:hypothetical protein